MKRWNRRHVLRGLGISLALPLFEPLLDLGRARAQTANAPKKKRFIGCFFGAGAAMPDAQNGDWTFEGALSPLVAAGHRNNVIVARGFRAVNHDDVHWTGTAAFLSCNLVGFNELKPPDPRAGERCGKSFDQYVADLEATRLRSLHAGWTTVPGWDESHDKHMSIQYVNCIAWRDERSPIQNTRNPSDMFTRVFGDGSSVADPQIQYLRSRRKSILDGVRGQLSSVRNTLTSEDRARLDAYEAGIREVETELATAPPAACDTSGLTVADPAPYLANMRTMQKIIVQAFRCNVTRAATIMYHEGIGDSSVHSSLSRKQHDCAHNDWEQLKRYNRMQVGLFAELLTGLKAAGQLTDTVLVLGSNMSDGRSHAAANAPFLLASEGPELKLGQEVIGTTDIANEAANRTIADIYMDLFRLYGVAKTSFGEGKDRSTGKPSGILT